MRRLTFQLIACLLAADASHAAVIHVNIAAAPDGAGASWATAMNDLPTALAIAQPGDEVWIARGVYHPTVSGNPSLTLSIPSGVVVRGGFAGDETSPAQRPTDPDPLSIDTAFDTVFSGEIGAPGIADNSTVVARMDGASASTRLERVAITGGSNPSSTGAGLSANASAGTISRCLFIDNAAFQGGGLRASGCVGLVIEGCAFMGNSADNAGAGAMLDFGTTQITNCLFRDNDCAYAGGGLALVQGTPTVSDCILELGDAQYGGGLYAEGDATIERCNIHHNTAFTVTGQTFTTGFGGGVFTKDGPTLIDCDINDNWGHNCGGISNEGGSGSSYLGCRFLRNSCFGSGGAGLLSQQGTWFVNCVFAENTSGFQAPMMQLRSFPAPASATFVNCTSVNNGVGAAAMSIGGTALILNSIFRNPGPEFTGNTPGIGWSNIEGFTGGLANIDADPLFADAALGDFRLLAGSPCIDAGRNDQVPAGISTDHASAPRFVDDPAAPDTGVGPAPIVDMGAFEAQPSPTHCPGDADSSGQVNFADITSVLTAFGGATPPGGPGDADANGTVDFGDITSVLTNWGNSCAP